MIFPDWGGVPAPTQTAALPVFREWAVDWERGTFALQNGAFYTVAGDEALKIWVWRALHPQSQRFQYTAWSHDYGNELAALLGGVTDQGILESRLKQYIREALQVCPYITQVDGFTFTKRGGMVTCAFAVHTVYHQFTQNLEVPIG